MSEQPSPLDALLDLVVYAPIGLALAVAGEVPELAARGRAKVEPQIATARVVGQFVVAEGRKRVVRLGGPLLAPTGSATPASGGPTQPRATPVAPSGPGTGSKSPSEPAPAPAEVAPDAPTTAGPEAASPVEPAPSVEGLAIPGYDSLSASQVVHRLAGLSSTELAAVGAYEAATRGRRTILARVSQLQSA